MTNVMKTFLQKYPIGSKLKITYRGSSNSDTCVVIAFEDDYLIVQTTAGLEKPVSYDLIGSYDLIDTEEAPTAHPLETNDKKYSGKFFPNEVSQVMSTYGVSIKARDILKQLNTDNDTRSKFVQCLNRFDDAVKNHEVAPRFERIHSIIKELSEIINPG